MNYKLVIFDFDGTLADSFPWFVSVVNDVADTYRFRRVEPAMIEQLRAGSAAEAMAYTGVARWKIPLIGRHVRRMMLRDIDRIPLFEGVEPMLHRLADAGFRLAILSSNSYPNIARVLGPRNVPLFSSYECGVSMFGKHAKLRKLLKRSGVACHEALCIGDEVRDIVAAQRENVAFGAVAWGYTSVETLQRLHPTVVYASVDDITTHLLTSAARLPLERPDPSCYDR